MGISPGICGPDFVGIFTRSIIYFQTHTNKMVKKKTKNKLGSLFLFGTVEFQIWFNAPNMFWLSIHSRQYARKYQRWIKCYLCLKRVQCLLREKHIQLAAIHFYISLHLTNCIHINNLNWFSQKPYKINKVVLVHSTDWKLA